MLFQLNIQTSIQSILKLAISRGKIFVKKDMYILS